MSYVQQHQLMRPVLDVARMFDIASNPDPLAIYESGNAGFQVWATRDHHPSDPDGWDLVLDKLDAGAFSKPCAYIASVDWKWSEDVEDMIVGLSISTTPYVLTDHLPGRFKSNTIVNRRVDLLFAMEKVRWIFAQASVPLVPFFKFYVDDQVWNG